MGARRKAGDVVVAQNGYSYTYIQNGQGLKRVLTHWLVAEVKYGRPPAPDERVIFIDGNRKNLSPGNVEYAKKGNQKKSLQRRQAYLVDRLRELQAELEDVEKQLAELDS
jgi:hypothetical protein